MAEENAGSASKPSWHERETAQALQRLANARANLAQLEEEQAAAGAPGASKGPVDPADLARASELEADIAKFITKASGRFGGSSARAKLEAAQGELQALLDRAGADSVADLRGERDEAAAPAVDPTVLDFARRECADAEQAFLEVAAMVMPDVDPDADSDDPDADLVAERDAYADDDTELDLRHEPFAAS